MPVHVFLWASLTVAAWQILPDRYIGPFHAWNPHAIMEFVITIFSTAWLGRGLMRYFGAHYGVLLTGLMGGFASSTATIHNMGVLAKAQPELADRAALGGVLSNLATLVQLGVLLQLLAPELLGLFIFPVSCGVAGMSAYAAWVLWRHASKPPSSFASATDEPSFDWQGLLMLTAVVCSVSYVSAALNALYGQNGLWLGAAMSGLVDAHAIVPTVASLLTQQQVQAHEALMPLLIALTANTLTKSLIAFQSGGWAYAKQVGCGVCLSTAAVWAGYFVEGAFNWV
jgi:uncharacterized membrane protein (DUF4010 family)